MIVLVLLWMSGKSTDEAMSDYITKAKQLLEADASSASA